MSELYIGLMSGTSADAIDGVLVDFSQDSPRLVASHSLPLSRELQGAIHALCESSAHEIDRLGVLDIQLAEQFARCVSRLLEQAKIDPDQVRAIGSHGQTVRHRPPQVLERAFSLQITDPNTLAYRTGITTVADFRRKDMAAGGQGAPLVPAFHQAVFANPGINRAIVNIGGISNLTLLPANRPCSGFDCGPGNVLLDGWVQEKLQQRFDRNGQWAASGQCREGLLRQLLTHPFLEQPPPKSTGREEFCRRWLQEQLEDNEETFSDRDIQATLLQFTAHSIGDALHTYFPQCEELYVCGGGVANGELMRALKARLPETQVLSCESLGVNPQWVEAMAFAWLAKQTLDQLPGNVPAVTGAQRPLVLGGVYLP